MNWLIVHSIHDESMQGIKHYPLGITVLHFAVAIQSFARQYKRMSLSCYILQLAHTVCVYCCGALYQIAMLQACCKPQLKGSQCWHSSTYLACWQSTTTISVCIGRYGSRVCEEWSHVIHYWATLSPSPTTDTHTHTHTHTLTIIMSGAVCISNVKSDIDRWKLREMFP